VPTAPVGASLAGFVARCRWPDPDGVDLALAVSGGPDSSALAILARAAGRSATVHHVDHGLRPQSAEEADRVAELADLLGYRFVAQRVRVPPGPNLEARARRARYEVLPSRVATGHTMDDQAETVLLNMLRGAGLDGLGAMSAGRAAGEAGPTDAGGRVGGEAGSRGNGGRAAEREGGPLRPLLGLRRHETREVCARVGWEPLEDPTNSDPRHRRNRVRAELLPLMADIAQRDPVPILARQAELAADAAAALDALAEGLDPCDVGALRRAGEVVAVRALRRLLRYGPEAHPPSSAEIRRVLQVVSGERVATEVAGGRRVGRRAGRLEIGAAGGGGGTVHASEGPGGSWGGPG
jgi:tRNA(Ile)-lysidine synthase